MATTPEGRVKDHVKKLLKEFKAYKHMPVQNGFGEAALDFHVCHLGCYAAIETKAPGKRPTPRQIDTMRKVIAAKGSVFLIDSDISLDFSGLKGWLRRPVAGYVSPAAMIELEEANATRND